MTNRTHRTLRLARVLRLAAFATLVLPAVLGTAAKAQSYSYSTIANFTIASGEYPESGLVLDNSGNLYGTTSTGGGASGEGTVFKIAAGTNTVTTLATFTGTANGSGPVATLTLDSSGNLYGTTRSGGSSNDGTVFKIASGTNTLTTLATFTGTSNGADPSASLTFDSSGNLYGTTSSGGSSNDGTVFAISAGANTFATLTSFTGTGNGSGPGSLTIDSSGNLYGTTASGGSSNDGTVFKIAAGTNALTTVATFTGTANGSDPNGGLARDGSGNLYGTASAGGSSNGGTAFQIAAGTNNLTTIATFTGAFGTNPNGGLILDSSGNLYGTNSGSVFEIAAGTNTVTTLYTFNVPGSGSNLNGGLSIDSNGNLYGTTDFGGTGINSPFFNGDGIAFKLTDTTPFLDSWTGGVAGSAAAPVSGNFTNGFTSLLVSGSSNATLAFGGASYTVTNDFTSAVTVNALGFSNTGAVTIAPGGAGTANQIFLDTNPNTGATPTIQLNNSGSVAIATNLALNAVTTVTGSGSATISGTVSGASGLTQSGTGSLILTGNNTNTGSWIVNAGTLQLSGGSDMMSVSVNSGGTLILTNGVQFANGGGFGTLTANSGGVVSLDKATITGGYLSGAGTFTVAGGPFAGTTLDNVTINATNGLTVGNGGHLILNNGELRSSITSGSGFVSWNGGLVTSAGSLNFGNGTTAAVSNMEVDGKLNIANGATVNNTVSSLVFGAGSQTNIGSKTATGGTLDLGGQTLELNGAFLSNNGTIQNGLVNINYGATAKGGGTYAGSYSVNYGGKIIFGNSPGTLTSGAATWNGGSSLGFQIDDATGTAGTGWGNSVVNGALTLNGTPSSKITLDLTSLLPTGGDSDFGALANFDPTQDYSWDYVTTTGGINGFNAADFFLDTSGFSAYNATDGGTFSVTESGNDLHVNFTASAAAPEPGALALLLGSGVLAIGVAVRRRIVR